MPILSAIGGASFRGFNPGGSSGLYPFTSFTFTNCSVTGRYGPTLAQMQSAYSASSWTQNTNFFNLGAYQGYQKWTVPKDGIYRITAIGARGGHASYSGVSLGGRGALARGDISLTKGEYIIIAIGQQGQDVQYGGGGGGGTFVVKSTGVPLVIAGGGGGAYYTTTDYRVAYSDASITTIAKPPNAAYANRGGGGAGGLTSNGRAGYGGLNYGIGFQAGLAGGDTPIQHSGTGGFGGGSGGEWNVYGSSGAGGGYSGGSTGITGGGGYASYNAQGGGSSYASGSNTTFTAAYGTAHGSATIEFLS